MISPPIVVLDPSSESVVTADVNSSVVECVLSSSVVKVDWPVKPVVR